ncbi:MAG: hypothetical protein M1818_000717 [Claussenomyces sp. TS43310]|nr:MAG: hypothetical protein M1818_000717 [Claussenomyces sp. TS43310]
MSYQYATVPQYYQTSGSLPMAVPAKSQYYSYAPATRGAYAVSPTDGADSVTGSSRNSGYNSGYSATSSSYAGSASGDYDSSSSSANGVDLQDYMQDRFSTAFDPVPLDRSLVTQAQTSGMLNAKHREVLDLQAKAQARLAKTRARFAEGMQDAKEVRRDLEWTQKKVSSMKSKASKKHPAEYKKARERYPSPEY